MKWTRHAFSALLLPMALVGCGDSPVAPPAPATIGITADRTAMREGESITVTASIRAADGTLLTGQTIAWSTSDGAIAIVSGNSAGAAQVTGVGHGRVTVSATVGSVSSSVLLDVTGKVASITLQPNIQLVEDSSTLVVAAPRSANGVLLPDRVVTFSLADSTVARIDGTGLLRGLVDGTTTLTVRSEGISTTTIVRVTGLVASVVLTAKNTQLSEPDSTELTVELRSRKGTMLTDRPVIWSASDSAIARLRVRTPTGAQVTAVGHGRVMITAAVGAVVGEVSINVRGRVATIVMPTEIQIDEDATMPVRPVLRSTNGVLLTDRAITYGVRDAAVAQVDGTGLLKGVTNGVTMLTARCEGVESSTSVVVMATIARIELTTDRYQLQEPDSIDISAQLYSPKGTVLSGRAITWLSSDPAIARLRVVSPTRVRTTAIGHGSVNIQASAGGVAQTARLTVRGLVARISLDHPTADLLAGQLLSIGARPLSSNGVLLTDRPITLSVDQPAVAAVTPTGNVTALVPGATVVRASSEGHNASSDVQVRRITQFAAGMNHVCALVETIGVYCWGGNFSGQLGTLDLVPSPTPRLVPGTAAVTRLALNSSGTCGTTTATEHLCWGNVTGPPVTLPTRNGPLAGLRDLTFGTNFNCGTRPDGLWYCGGNNQVGQTGTGATELFLPLPRPLARQGFVRLVTAAESQHACGLDDSGAAWCWGYNEFAQLGDGTRTNRMQPVPLLSGQRFTLLATSLFGSCGTTPAGALLCWGVVSPSAPSMPSTITPVTLSSSIAFRSLGLSSSHGCGLTTNGEAYCWGAGSRGALGSGVRVDQSTPQLVTGGLRWASLAVFPQATCGLTQDNRVYCWGANDVGSLGDGTTFDRLVPTAVRWPSLPQRTP